MYQINNVEVFFKDELKCRVFNYIFKFEFPKIDDSSIDHKKIINFIIKDENSKEQ